MYMKAIQVLFDESSFVISAGTRRLSATDAPQS
jgi:hypothetical protein